MPKWFLALQPMFPPKRFDNFPRLIGWMLRRFQEGLDAFIFFFGHDKRLSNEKCPMRFVAAARL